MKPVIGTRESIVTLNPLSLLVGDVVLSHGVLLRITHVNRRWIDDRGEVVVNWGTECIGMMVDGYVRHDPQFRAWAENGEYHVQGNRWAVVSIVPQLAYRP